MLPLSEEMSVENRDLRSNRRVDVDNVLSNTDEEYAFEFVTARDGPKKRQVKCSSFAESNWRFDWTCQ